MRRLYLAACLAIVTSIGMPDAATAARQLVVAGEEARTDADDGSQADLGCAQGVDDRSSDLCAQWKAADSAEESADWAARAFWLGAVGTALLLWTLGYTAKGTRAAADAVDTQINSERPLMQLVELEYSAFDPFADPPSFGYGYTVENLGSTGCWIESLDVSVYTNTETTPPPNETHAFVGPEKSITTLGLGHRANFWPEELTDFMATPALFCVGSITYRNAGGMRWQTGFAVRSIIENGKSKAFNPWPAKDHWYDRRLPTASTGKWSLRVPWQRNGGSTAP